MDNKISKHHPLLCDPETGMCEMPNNEIKEEAKGKIIQSAEKQLKLVYFTDPICSSCWGIEPQLRKLKLEYGHVITIEYRMGGLLPDWNYNSGGISKPSDVAHHWDEVSVHYDMPIDGDVWLEDPLHSSYPPSIAFKAAQMQDEELASLFLREIREMVFLKKINIAKWKPLETAAKKVGLNIMQFKTDFEGKATALFEKDLEMARAFGVRGFPTIFFLDETTNKETVYGTNPYRVYETAILKINAAIIKSDYGKDWRTLFLKYHSLTVKEFSVLSETSRMESEEVLNKLTESGVLAKLHTKNGALWLLNKNT